jgi:hypothetical protein
MPRGCSLCGYDNENDAIFCRNCGTSLAVSKKSLGQLSEPHVEASISDSIESQPAGVATKLSNVFSSLRSIRAPTSPSKDGLQFNSQYEKLVSKFEKLSTLNRTLKEELRMAQERINQIDKRLATNDTETDEALRGIRASMKRLLDETDERIP